MLNSVFQHLDAFKQSGILLGGGTALARFYLHHRVSYDLDFFLAVPFDPMVLSRRLQQAGLTFEITGLECGGTFAAQLHGLVTIKNSEPINISFVEDVFTGMFETIEIQGVRTEIIEGLFHRKLRTVSGTGVTLGPSGHLLGEGQRQKARDLYDLYILDTRVEPVEKFIQRINSKGAGFPADIFRQNLAAVDWMELIDECEILEVLAPFEKMAAMDLKRHFDGIMMRMLECNI